MFPSRIAEVAWFKWCIRSAGSKLVLFSNEIYLTNVLPELNTKIRQLFDFDFPGLLDPVREEPKRTRTKRPKNRGSTKTARKRR